jgi:CHAD domain-containing protein
MHRAFGAGSVDSDATAYGREHGATVIDGGCPLMFELETAMRSERATELMTRWHAWLAQPVASAVPPHAGRPLGKLVARRIARAHRTVIEHGRLIDADTPAEQIHALRKKAKKLRYLLESFGSLVPARDRKPYVKRLKALQDNLGEYQDADVQSACCAPSAMNFTMPARRPTR